MASRRKTTPEVDLARRVVLATAELAGRSLQRGIAVGAVMTRLGTEDEAAIDAAIAYAVDQGWLRSAGSPPFSLQLRHGGLKLVG